LGRSWAPTVNETRTAIAASVRITMGNSSS
jgi:hypothetical protein